MIRGMNTLSRLLRAVLLSLTFASMPMWFGCASMGEAATTNQPSDAGEWVRRVTNAYDSGGQFASLRVLRFEPLHDPVVQPRQVADGEWSYDTPDAPFAVTRLEVRSGHLHTARTRELVFCTAGALPDVATGECAFLAPGDSMPLGTSATVWIVAETTTEISIASS